MLHRFYFLRFKTFARTAELSRTFSILEVLHRRWWNPRRNFVFKRHPNRRPFGHSKLRYGAELVAFWSVQVFMLASVPPPCNSCRNGSFCRGRAYSFAAFLAASFPGTSVQPIAVALVNEIHVPLDTILNMHGPFFGSPRRALYTRCVKTILGGRQNVISELETYNVSTKHLSFYPKLVGEPRLCTCQFQHQGSCDVSRSVSFESH